jgi:hypothetical protein
VVAPDAGPDTGVAGAGRGAAPPGDQDHAGAYNPDLWGPAPRRLDADGRTIRLGWFRKLDRQLLNMTGDLGRDRLDFLVVPPDTTATAAEHAFAAATDRANQQAPTELLDTLEAAGPQVPTPRSADVPDTEETMVRDVEGGRQHR